MEEGASPMRSLLDFARMVNTALEQVTIDTLAACQATGMIIHYSTPGSFVAPHVAEKGKVPAVVPKPADWGKNVDMTGYWFLDGEVDWEPSTQLADFLAAGSPPVYIGFGSMSTRDPEHETEIVYRPTGRSDFRGDE